MALFFQFIRFLCGLFFANKQPRVSNPILFQKIENRGIFEPSMVFLTSQPFEFESGLFKTGKDPN